MTDDDPNKPVLLLSCANEFEAELRASALRAEGIEVRTVTAAASALWHIGPATGYPYHVFVRSADVERARAVISENADAARRGMMDFKDQQADDAESGNASLEVRREMEPLSGATAFILGLAMGLLTVFIPITLSALVNAPFSRPERAIFGALWVLFFGMVAYVLRERFPVSARGEVAERDDGVTRTHFRDSRLALVGWFVLGAAFFGPTTFFFIGILLLPVINLLRAHTAAADAIVITAWCLLCGILTVRHALGRQRARREERDTPKLAR
jgi:hypothetical protein